MGRRHSQGKPEKEEGPERGGTCAPKEEEMTNSKESRTMTEIMNDMRVMRRGRSVGMDSDEIDRVINDKHKGKPRKEPKKK